MNVIERVRRIRQEIIDIDKQLAGDGRLKWESVALQNAHQALNWFEERYDAE